jgi:hypothetical protein
MNRLFGASTRTVRFGGLSKTTLVPIIGAGKFADLAHQLKIMGKSDQLLRAFCTGKGSSHSQGKGAPVPQGSFERSN